MAEVETSNCTYAPLSENAYLSDLIDTGMALTVRIMLPLGTFLFLRPNTIPTETCSR